jgi:putative intracellular protease/amidase
MTHNPELLPTMTNSDPLARCALFVAFEGMGLLDLTGPLTVFWSASKFMERQSKHGYARHGVCLDGGPILTAEGVTIETVAIAQFESAEIDTIVVPGALDMEPTLADHRLVDWLAVHAPRARRTVSVCAGAFLLAEAGLLDGRRAVTHWASCELLDPCRASTASRAAADSVMRSVCAPPSNDTWPSRPETIAAASRPAQRHLPAAQMIAMEVSRSWWRDQTVVPKRFRYSRGGIPKILMKEHRICSSLLNPESSATDSIRSSVCSRRRLAASTRIASTAFAGVRPRFSA